MYQQSRGGIDIEFNIYDKISLELIINDGNTIRYLCEYVEDKNYASEFYLGMMPYISIWIDSSYTYFKKLGVDICTSEEDKKLIKQVRGKIKMYNEKIKKNIEKSNSIYEVQDNLFKSITKYNFVRRLKLYYNLGTYSVNGKYIGNTYLYHWYYGCNTKEEIPNISIIEEKGKRISNILSDVLNIVGRIYTNNDKVSLLSNKIDINHKDYNLAKKNNRIFKKQYKDDITYMLFNIICSINFVIYFLKDILPEDNMLYFRIKYNCYYYSIYSLDKIMIYINTNKYDDKGMKNKLEHIKLGNDIIGNKLRNSMAHYNITIADLDYEEIREEYKFYGLIEKYYGSNFDTLNSDISKHLIQLADELENLILN